MSKAALLLGAQGFLGGMPLLKHLPVKISEFLHKVHHDKFSSFGLPRIQDSLSMDQIERLFQQIEKVDKDDAVIILHGGVLIGHREYEGFQRVYAWSFPNKKAETRRLFELDPMLPRLYVMPITSILGRVPLVRAGNTGTIPHHMRGRKEQCFPGGKADSVPGKGDGSRLYFVNSWAMKWSQNP